MIDKDRLAKVTDVFFHASCPDGTAAAMIVADTYAAMEWEVKLHSVQYGTDFHANLRAEPGQLFVDITPPIGRWREWLEHTPIVLDHHETAREVTEGLGGVYATNERSSGAVLAYEQVAVPLFGGNDEWRKFAETAMIRDTWKKDHALWKEACAQAYALQLFGSRRLIEQVQEGSFQHRQLEEVGRLLLDSSDRSSKKAAGGSVRQTVSVGGQDYSVATFNCTEKIISDAANLLLEEGADVAAGYFFLFEDGVQRAVVSLRTKGRVSARAMAESQGGGGHDRAAGFKIEPADRVSPSVVAEIVRAALAAAGRSA
jgi:oligoribonuclease NrnB/cAMP/cGMP phosphodiesterase (DHH superfamily)